MISLRPMREDDVALIERWDDDPDIAAFGGGTHWYDWPVELTRELPWRELLIAEEAGRPVGFVQLIDAAEEESHYWGDVDPDTWALDIWIGQPSDRDRGVGTGMMTAALDRCFDHHGAAAVAIDPLADNERAIRFYQRIGFTPVGERWFDEDRCLVHHLDRGTWERSRGATDDR
jgi:aminoglycoside 6'-N-acetyltransferase